MKNHMVRIKKVQKIMEENHYHYLLLGPSANMYYFTGLSTRPDERLQLVLIPVEGEPTVILPEMYKEKVTKQIGDSIPICFWADQQDPVDLVKKVVKRKSAHTICVDDTLITSHFLQVMPVFPGSIFYPASQVIDPLRMCKDEEEIAFITQVQVMADEVMEMVKEKIYPGMRERDLAFFVESAYNQVGSDGISFKPIVASGPNSSSSYPPGDREFQTGDMIKVDCGGVLKGYCSDITRTFCLGRAGEEEKFVYQTVKEANEKAFLRIAKSFEEGKDCTGEDVDRAAREVILNKGYGPYFIHRTGHGIGLNIHEAPYLVEGNKVKLLPGMVFSIEPGIYLPEKYGVRIEDIVAITQKGPVWLSHFTKELLEL